MRSLALAIMLLVAAFGNQALARSDTAPWPDRGQGWLEITQDKADSTCLGDLSTPICATETFLACFLRNRSDWCSDVFNERYIFHSHPLPGYALLYKIRKVKALKTGRIVYRRSEDGTPWTEDVKNGDVLVDILRWECRENTHEKQKPTCQTDIDRQRFIFRKIGERWILLSASLMGRALPYRSRRLP